MKGNLSLNSDSVKIIVIYDFFAGKICFPDSENSKIISVQMTKADTSGMDQRLKRSKVRIQKKFAYQLP